MSRDMFVVFNMIFLINIFAYIRYFVNLSKDVVNA